MNSEAPEIVVAHALRRDADRQETRMLKEIGAEFRATERLKLAAESHPKLMAIAWSFWEGWIDTRNHDWMYYDGIDRDDWPGYARLIADALESGGQITEPVLLHHFWNVSEVRGPGLLAWLRGVFKRRGLYNNGTKPSAPVE